MSNFQSNKTDGSESLFGEVIFSYTRAQRQILASLAATCAQRAESFIATLARAAPLKGAKHIHSAYYCDAELTATPEGWCVYPSYM